MKTITLNKENTIHILGNLYKWIPDNHEPYNLVVEDGIDITTRGGNIDTHGGSIYTNGGRIYTNGGNIYTYGGNIDTNGGNIYTRGGNIHTHGGSIYTNGGRITSNKLTCGTLYWQSMSIPDVKEIECKIVYPETSTRSHWQERLSDWVDISEGCYEELLEKVRPHLDDILTSEKWSKCERWIIGSWRA